MHPSDSDALSRKAFLTARCLAMSGDDAGAIQLFGELVPTDEEMAVSAVIGQAEALMRTGQGPGAEALLEGFLSRNPEHPRPARAFHGSGQVVFFKQGIHF